MRLHRSEKAPIRRAMHQAARVSWRQRQVRDNTVGGMIGSNREVDATVGSYGPTCPNAFSWAKGRRDVIKSLVTAIVHLHKTITAAAVPRRPERGSLDICTNISSGTTTPIIPPVSYQNSLALVDQITGTDVTAAFPSGNCCRKRFLSSAVTTVSAMPSYVIDTAIVSHYNPAQELSH